MMKKTARDIVRRMRCGEYGPDAILADGTQLSESPAAGLFAECAAHFRRQERRMRGMTFWLVLWLMVATAGGSSLLVFESGSGWHFAGMAGGVAGAFRLDSAVHGAGVEPDAGEHFSGASGLAGAALVYTVLDFLLVVPGVSAAP